MKTNIQIWAIAKLLPYAGTLRRNDDAIDRMVAAFNEFKLMPPLLVRGDGEIIDGHLRANFLKVNWQRGAEGFGLDKKSDPKRTHMTRHEKREIADFASGRCQMTFGPLRRSEKEPRCRKSSVSPTLLVRSGIPALKKNMATQSKKNRHLPCTLEPRPRERMERPVAKPVERRHEKREIADFAGGGVK